MLIFVFQYFKIDEEANKKNSVKLGKRLQSLVGYR